MAIAYVAELSNHEQKDWCSLELTSNCGSCYSVQMLGVLPGHKCMAKSNLTESVKEKSDPLCEIEHTNEKA